MRANSSCRPPSAVLGPRAGCSPPVPDRTSCFVAERGAGDPGVRANEPSWRSCSASRIRPRGPTCEWSCRVSTCASTRRPPRSSGFASTASTRIAWRRAPTAVEAVVGWLLAGTRPRGLDGSGAPSRALTPGHEGRDDGHVPNGRFLIGTGAACRQRAFVTLQGNPAGPRTGADRRGGRCDVDRPTDGIDMSELADLIAAGPPPSPSRCARSPRRSCSSSAGTRRADSRSGAFAGAADPAGFAGADEVRAEGWRPDSPAAAVAGLTAGRDGSAGGPFGCLPGAGHGASPADPTWASWLAGRGSRPGAPDSCARHRARLGPAPKIAAVGADAALPVPNRPAFLPPCHRDRATRHERAADEARRAATGTRSPRPNATPRTLDRELAARPGSTPGLPCRPRLVHVGGAPVGVLHWRGSTTLAGRRAKG